MKAVWGWIKNNKLASFLIVVLFLLVLKDFVNKPIYTPRNSYRTEGLVGSLGMAKPLSSVKEAGVNLPPSSEPAPSESKDRLVVKTSSLSLVVDDVRKASGEIVDYAKSVGGFMVSTSLNKPQEAPFATVVIRVPADKLTDTLDAGDSL